MLDTAPCPTGILTVGEFQAAVDPVLPILKRYARRLASTNADIEDLVQDTLLKAWAARTSFRPGSNLRAWLIRIARNTFLTARRRAGRQVLWEPDEIARTLTVASDQETAVMLEDLNTAVANLPSPQRRAFESVVVEGLSYEEAASKLDVELGTLKSRTSRARATLAKKLDQLPEPFAAPPSVHTPVASSVGSNIYARWKASGSRMIGLPPASVAVR